MKISVIIPIFNEERYIEKIIAKVSKVNIEKEIIIVNDGSTDTTLRLLKKLKFKNLKIIPCETIRDMATLLELH